MAVIGQFAATGHINQMENKRVRERTAALQAVDGA